MNLPHINTYFFLDLIDYQLKIFTLLVLYDFYINISYNFKYISLYH